MVNPRDIAGNAEEEETKLNLTPPIHFNKEQKNQHPYSASCRPDGPVVRGLFRVLGTRRSYPGQHSTSSRVVKTLLEQKQTSLEPEKQWIWPTGGSGFGSLSCLMQCRGFDPPPPRIFPVEEIFSLELTWVLTPFHPNSSDEGINRGLVCAHVHSIARTQKILTSMS